MSSVHQQNNTRAYRKARERFKNEGRANDEPCWICGGAIDYDAEPRTPYSHTLDHVYTATKHPEYFHDEGNWRHAHASCNSRSGEANMTRECEELPRWW